MIYNRISTKIHYFSVNSPLTIPLLSGKILLPFGEEKHFSGEVLGEVNTLEKPFFDIILAQKKPGNFPKLSFRLLIIRNLPILTC